ncbi:DNA starvation/stationary phase protection protein Dps [Planctomycetales bacterium 10988]|nr:DNA starvation/stationary phase protection protein Dps [Planctomycetales bacterium 10988]
MATTVSTKSFPTKIDVADATRAELAELLNARLTDVLDLRMQAKQAHWNVKGPSFIALHELFDQVAEEMANFSDLIAERITILGHVADGRVATVAEGTGMPAYPGDIADGLDHVEALSTSLAAFGKVIREAIEKSDELGDPTTADLFTEVSRGTDKYLWFVEAHNHAKK